MKIGILQAGHVPEPLLQKHGTFDSMFETLLSGHGFSFKTYVVVDNHFPESEDECDAWLITGSAHGAYEDHAFIPPLEELIRKAFAKKIPLAGICFGHQLMAQALGGKVVKSEKGWGVGNNVYQMNGREIELNAMHQDQVVKLPEEAEVICHSDFCEFAGLAYKDHAISFQPHPEFNTDFMRDLILYKQKNGLPDQAAEKALDELVEKNNSPEIALQLAKFFISAKTSMAA